MGLMRVKDALYFLPGTSDHSRSSLLFSMDRSTGAPLYQPFLEKLQSNVKPRLWRIRGRETHVSFQLHMLDCALNKKITSLVVSIPVCVLSGS